MINYYEEVQTRIDKWILENTNKKNKSSLNLERLQVEKYENIPDTVESIICNGNKAIKTLQGLPENLKKLDFSSFPLGSFDYLPPNLEYLQCDASKIEEIHNLPNTIKKLKISCYPYLKRVISLPDSLKELDFNQANDLEEICCQFPKTLRKLNLSMTKLKEIPIIPDTVTIFNISMNSHIKEIPNLPPLLKVLTIFGTNIKSLPYLPDNILRLDIDRLSQLDNNSIPNSVRYLDSFELKLEDPTFKAFVI
jgi:hypothetical protein